MSSPERRPSASPPAGGVFVTTRWSLVRQACGEADDEQGTTREALAAICREYWYPLYAFVRRTGKSEPDAQDLTQEFFARLLEKGWLASVEPERGRFRCWLLAAMKHFLAKEWRDARREKRGGRLELVALDALSPEERYAREPADHLTADQLYDRRLALDLLERGLARLELEAVSPEKKAQFAALKFSLTGERIPLADVAARLHMSEGAVKVAIHRLRERYRALIRAEIAETVQNPEDVDSELAELFAALRTGP